MPRPLGHRVAAASAVALGLLTLPGCRARHELGLTVRADGAGELSLAYGFDEGALRAMARRGVDPDTMLDETTPVLPGAPAGTKKIPWRADGFRGYRIVAPFRDEASLQELFSGPDARPPTVSVVRSDRQMRFRLDARPYVEESIAAPARAVLTQLGEPGDAGLLDDLADAFEARLAVRLPGRLVSTNAPTTTRDGTLVWHLLPPPGRVFEATTSLVPHRSGHPVGLGRTSVLLGAARLAAPFGLLGLLGWLARRLGRRRLARRPAC